jgi:malonate transporter
LELGAIAIAFLVPISNIVSVVAILMLGHPAGKTNMKRAILSEIARNPLLGSMLVGVTVNILNIPVPEFISQAASILGGGALPLLLLTIGASLKFSAIGGNAAPLGLALLAKFLVFPLALVTIGLGLGLDPLSLAVLAAVGAAPTANSSYTLAAELGGDAQLMAEILSLQTLAAAVSLPLWIWLAGVLAAI